MNARSLWRSSSLGTPPLRTVAKAGPAGPSVGLAAHEIDDVQLPGLQPVAVKPASSAQTADATPRSRRMWVRPQQRGYTTGVCAVLAEELSRSERVRPDDPPPARLLHERHEPQRLRRPRCIHCDLRIEVDGTRQIAGSSRRLRPLERPGPFARATRPAPQLPSPATCPSHAWCGTDRVAASVYSKEGAPMSDGVEQITALRRRYAAGESAAALAREFGIVDRTHCWRPSGWAVLAAMTRRSRFENVHQVRRRERPGRVLRQGRHVHAVLP